MSLFVLRVLVGVGVGVFAAPFHSSLMKLREEGTS